MASRNLSVAWIYLQRPTGEVLGPPAKSGVTRHNTQVEGDDVEVEVG